MRVLQNALAAKMSNKIPYLHRRGDTFSFRIAVPIDLIPIIRRRELTKALETSDRVAAIPRTLQLAANAKNLFNELRNMTKKNYPPPVGYEFELNLDAFKNPTGVKVKAELHETEALIYAIRESAEALRRNQLPNPPHAIEPYLVPALPVPKSDMSLAKVAELFLDDYPVKKEGMLKKHKACIPAFLEVVGDIPMNHLKRIQVKEFFQLLQKLPPRWADMKRSEGLSIRQIAEGEYAALISEKTFDSTYKTSINQFLSWGHETFGDQGFPKIEIEMIKYEGEFLAGEKSQRAFKLGELKRLFEGEEMSKYASSLDAAHYCWLPLIGLFTGARVNEICQLNPQQDIRRDDETSIWYFFITGDTDAADDIKKRTKNLISKRKVPIHSKLMELGFLKYFERVKGTGAKLIFPQWSPSRNRASGLAEKWFRNFLQETGLRDETKGERIVGMHAFRSTLSNAARNAGVDESHIVGHIVKDSDRTKEGYRGELALPNKQAILEKIQFDVNFIAPA